MVERRDRREALLAVCQVRAGPVRDARPQSALRFAVGTLLPDHATVGAAEERARCLPVPGTKTSACWSGCSPLGSLRVVGHVGDVDPGVGGPHDRAPVGAARPAERLQLVVVHRAGQEHLVGLARRAARRPCRRSTGPGRSCTSRSPACPGVGVGEQRPRRRGRGRRRRCAGGRRRCCRSTSRHRDRSASLPLGRVASRELDTAVEAGRRVARGLDRVDALPGPARRPSRGRGRSRTSRRRLGPCASGRTWIFEMPPRKESAPVGELGLTTSESWLSASRQVLPPSRASRRARPCGASGRSEPAAVDRGRPVPGDGGADEEVLGVAAGRPRPLRPSD